MRYAKVRGRVLIQTKPRPYQFKSIALLRLTGLGSQETQPEEPLQKDQLKAGYVYEIKARNFYLGVWDGQEAFLGARYKFGPHPYLSAEFLAREAGGTPNGFDTATPYYEIGPSPCPLPIYGDGCFAREDILQYLVHLTKGIKP